MGFFRAIGVILELFWRPIRAVVAPKPPILVLEAEYAGGLTFEGTRGTFSRVEWARADAGSSPCPLSAFPDEIGEIDPATLESPDALHRLGITLEDKTSMKKPPSRSGRDNLRNFPNIHSASSARAERH